MTQTLSPGERSAAGHRPARTGAPTRGERRRVPVPAAVLGLAALALGSAAPLGAGEADVLEGRATALGDGRYRIDATVRHADAGWEHYADRWDVLAPDGRVLGRRELLHPHDDEQPFTRSLTLAIPADVTRVTLRASDSVHGAGGATLELELTRPALP